MSSIPLGWQCKGSVSFGDGNSDACGATITVTNPPTPDPGDAGDGPAIICWNASGSPPNDSSFSGGSCDPPSPCEATLIVELDINPFPNYLPPWESPKFYDYWHGAGQWEIRERAIAAQLPVPVPPGPTWNVTGTTGDVQHKWGLPSSPPIPSVDGHSVARMVLTAKLDCGESQSVTITATPEGGGAAATITFEFECGSCS